MRAVLLSMTRGIGVAAAAASALLQLSTPAWSEQTLTPHTARYDVRISVLGGTLTSKVTEAAPGYMANSVIRPAGMSRMVARGVIQESSYFLLGPDGVQPTQYRSVDTLSSEDQTVSLDFNWREHTVEGLVNDQEFHTGLDGRVHDRVSIQYELMLDLLNGQAEKQYWMLDGDELKLLNVTNIGARKVEVPYGTFEAIGIQHSKENSSRITTLWCAEELGYLPVIIEQHRDGKLRVRAVLKNYEPVAESVASFDP
ncbi:MAG: DUF3108 domain-containing protein [Woeseia sp.]